MQVNAMQSLALGLLAAFLMAAALVPAVDSSDVYEINLRNGVKSSTLPEGMSWYSELTDGQGSCICDRQGVLKLTFGPRHQVAEIKMIFEYSKDWTFNVGDSQTNNGWAGDGSTQDNDAEVHSMGNSLFFYGRDRSYGRTWGLLHKESGFVGMQPYTTLTLNISDETVTADNGLHYIHYQSHKLFALRGQNDTAYGGVNNDVYLGMNRVVGGSYRAGTGLCQISVQFHPS